MVTRAESSEFSLLLLISWHHRPSHLGYSSLLKVNVMAVPFPLTVHNPKAPKNKTTGSHHKLDTLMFPSPFSGAERRLMRGRKRLDKTVSSLAVQSIL